MPRRIGVKKPRSTPFRRPIESTAARWRKHCVDVMRHHWHASMRMWACLLIETEKDLRGRKGSEDYEKALDWVLEHDPTYTLGTFDGVCCALDLDETFVRADLLKDTAREVA